MTRFHLRPGVLPALTLMLAIGACGASRQSADRAEVEIRGTDPNAATAALPPPSSATAPVAAASGAAPGATVPSGQSGVIDYGDYRVAVAASGDTVTSLAERIGMSGSELGAYNGLQPSSELLAGDELVLPENATITVAAAAPAPEPVAAAPVASVEAQPLSGDEGTVALAVAGDAEPSDGWSPDLAAAAIDRSDPGDPAEAPLPPPPTADAPIPAAPAEPRDIVPADLGQYQSPTNLATPFQLTRPVNGTVAIPFNLAGGDQRNEGVDFAAPAGAAVVAAEDGEVALVSESLGGLGTIVLIRHPDDILTVYGRLDDVTVEKGDYLERGQTFGAVADAPSGTEPRMHFEVRRGAESIDPMTML